MAFASVLTRVPPDGGSLEMGPLFSPLPGVKLATTGWEVAQAWRDGHSLGPVTVKSGQWAGNQANIFKPLVQWASASKESTCSAGDLGLISGLGRSPGEG